MNNLNEIMTTDIETVCRSDNAFEAARKMESLNVGAIPVVEGNDLVGMITDRDLAIRGYAQKQPATTSVEDLMSNQIITGSPEMSVDEAAELMAENQIRRLPIVENGKMVGIVSIGDLAVRNDSADEAGEALSEISKP